MWRILYAFKMKKYLCLLITEHSDGYSALANGCNESNYKRSIQKLPTLAMAEERNRVTPLPFVI